MKDTKVAIIGQGRSGRDIHGAYLKSDLNKNFEVVAIVELDPARRELAKKEWPGADIYSDYRDLYKRDDIDFVVNATYSQDHFAITLDLLNAGKNVLVEKPMARTRYECDKMIKCAEDNGVSLAVFQQSFYAPYYVFAKETADSGKLGEILQVDLTFNGFSRRWDWQTLQSKVAGGVYNTGPHPFGLALGFLDFASDAKVVYSRLACALTSGDSDDYAKAIITAAGKPTVDLEVISCDGYPTSTIKVIGTKGTLKCSVSGEYTMKYIVDGENPPRPVIEESLKNSEGMPAYCSESLVSHEESGKLDGSAFDVAVDTLYESFRAKIKTGAPMKIGAKEAAQVIGLIEQTHAMNPLPVRY